MGVKGRRGKFARTAGQKDLDLKDVARLYVEGKSPTEINRFLNSNRPYTLTLSSTLDDIKLVKAEWAKYRVEKFDELVGEVLAELKWVKCEAIKDWFNSTDTKCLGVVLDTIQTKMKLLNMGNNITNNLTLVQQNIFNRKEFYRDVGRLQQLSDEELLGLLNDELEDQKVLARQSKKNKLLPGVLSGDN